MIAKLKSILGVTMGDTAGIGPESIVSLIAGGSVKKALADDEMAALVR